jgi:hypothetical protein
VKQINAKVRDLNLNHRALAMFCASKIVDRFVPGKIDYRMCENQKEYYEMFSPFLSKPLGEFHTFLQHEDFSKKNLLKIKNIGKTTLRQIDDGFEKNGYPAIFDNIKQNVQKILISIEDLKQTIISNGAMTEDVNLKFALLENTVLARDKCGRGELK